MDEVVAVNDVHFICKKCSLDIHIFFILQQVLSDRLKSPVIFSHNDLLSGNIMINHEEGSHIPQ